MLLLTRFIFGVVYSIHKTIKLLTMAFLAQEVLLYVI